MLSEDVTRMKKNLEVKHDPAACDCSFGDLLAKGRITQDEYLYLMGKLSEPEIVERIGHIRPIGCTDGVSGVFYSLSEGRISVGKAMEVVKEYLLTGNLAAYTEAEGVTVDQAEIDILRERLNEIK